MWKAQLAGASARLKVPAAPPEAKSKEAHSGGRQCRDPRKTARYRSVTREWASNEESNGDYRGEEGDSQAAVGHGVQETVAGGGQK
jgi:hypothetical protein